MKQNFLTRDWGLKLISLVLAIGLWYYAVGEEGIEFARTVPLEIELKNEHLSILEVSTQDLQVTLNAPRGMLSKIASEDIVARHKIGSEVESAGDYSFKIVPSEIDLPTPYARVTKIEPEVVHVSIDELIIKKLKIQPTFLAEPAVGYSVRKDEIQLNPNAILIEGPKAQLDTLDYVRTKPVDLVGRIRSFRRTAELDLPSNVRPLSEAFIDVFVPIKEEFDEKQFDGIPIRVLGSPDDDRLVTIEPESISFVLKGAARRLQGLEGEHGILAYVDIKDLKPGTHEVPVKLVLPEEVSLKEDSNVNVQITITKAK